MMAIDAGLITTAVCCYGDNPLSGNPGTYGRPVGTDAAYGMIGAPGGYAMIAQRHMTEFGTTSEQLGAVAVSTRGWASKNPNAHKRDPLTLEDHQASRYVTWPLHLLDCCLVSDGGAAVVVTSADRARHLRKPPVYIMGIGQHHIAWDLPHRPTLTTSGAKISGEKAFRMAGIGPGDIDICEIYDCFTIVPINHPGRLRLLRQGRGRSVRRRRAHRPRRLPPHEHRRRPPLRKRGWPVCSSSSRASGS